MTTGSRPLANADIIYDWNEIMRDGPLFPRPVSVFDETLRDGVQSPSVRDPSIDAKIRIMHLLDKLGVTQVNIGMPGSGPRAVEDALILARELKDARLSILPTCAARTHPHDILPIIDISQKVGIKIEVMTFIGSSPIRAYAEDWDVARIAKLSADAIDLIVKAGLPATYVTEDTSRSSPEMLDVLFRNAIDHGARRLCLCDTAGHATPDGVSNLVHFTRGVIKRVGAPIGIDWHGHNDRGLAVANAIFALECGADRVHGTVLGIGERVGNAAIDQILLNLKLLGYLARDLSSLATLCQEVATSCNVTIPPNYPVVGADAFRTATGVHAAAIIKAERKGHAFLADRVYSSVPASMVGRQQEIEIGHMSGESTIIYWLKQRGIEPETSLVKHIYTAAKASHGLLGESEIHRLIEEHHQSVASSGPAAPHMDRETPR